MQLPNLKVLQERTEALINQMQRVQTENADLRQEIVTCLKRNERLLAEMVLLEKKSTGMEKLYNREEIIKKHLHKILTKLNRVDMALKGIEI